VVLTRVWVADDLQPGLTDDSARVPVVGEAGAAGLAPSLPFSRRRAADLWLLRWRRGGVGGGGGDATASPPLL